ncbi:hypothetical protein ACP93_04925 [Xanthomonas sp. NCPPB 1128]|uniref:hypothetical protein n=1 Tax=Xanthomonas sp. NCPPB 1128 TaxID=1775876 RepID=UPI00065AE645|nr:hypothetical protein [Xanthomonas sp. NCPPB 1128]KMM76754.1 hypothetical protein ACP93_04925 [Xanthomonas sp. NCPPB 1128]
MANAVFYLFAATVALVTVSLYRYNRRRIDTLLMESFRQLSFSSDGVALRGVDLQVVKKAQQFIRTNESFSLLPDRPVVHQGDAFWYCRGPGARWFVAIPSVVSRGGELEVSWVVRPLTEQRMRAALQFDRKAFRRAFGDQDVS